MHSKHVHKDFSLVVNTIKTWFTLSPQITHFFPLRVKLYSNRDFYK